MLPSSPQATPLSIDPIKDFYSASIAVDYSQDAYTICWNIVLRRLEQPIEFEQVAKLACSVMAEYPLVSIKKLLDFKRKSMTCEKLALARCYLHMICHSLGTIPHRSKRENVADFLAHCLEFSIHMIGLVNSSEWQAIVMGSMEVGALVMITFSQLADNSIDEDNNQKLIRYMRYLALPQEIPPSELSDDRLVSSSRRPAISTLFKHMVVKARSTLADERSKAQMDRILASCGVPFWKDTELCHA